MEETKIQQIAFQIIETIERLLPEYLENEVDRNINNGNVAVCIIDDAGRIFGKMFGNDKSRQKPTFKTAETKATQVWVTGIETGKYEELVYTGQVDWFKYGIMKPDLAGWDGGVPIKLDETSSLAVGFSGFRGEIDRELVLRATAEVLGK